MYEFDTKNLLDLDFDKEAEELTQVLIDRALNSVQFEYEELHNIQEFSCAKTLRDALHKITNGFKQAAKELWTTYTHNLNSFIDDPNILLTYSKMKYCAEFYANEVKTLNKSIHEYEDHMIIHGHLLSALLGYEREDYE